ncbi:NUDIX domain-containing protein [Kribbella sp. NPDC048915]|uniref:NUDIX hydrolase n=1 Tax=Kribbella sp. NPDC048915 TaxID=3155148 RepID=UPI0033C71074
MLHADAVSVLERWRAPNTEQEDLRTHYLRHLAVHPDGMWRTCRPEHVTASALVVDAAGENTLLTLHKTVGRWLQLGGHCEPTDTTLSGAALREATEESGLPGLTVGPEPLQLSRHLLEAGGCAGVYHLDVQYLVTATTTQYTVSDESEALAWFPLTALPPHTDHSVKSLATQALRHLSLPHP